VLAFRHAHVEAGAPEQFGTQGTHGARGTETSFHCRGYYKGDWTAGFYGETGKRLVAVPVLTIYLEKQ